MAGHSKVANIIEKAGKIRREENSSPNSSEKSRSLLELEEPMLHQIQD